MTTPKGDELRIAPATGQQRADALALLFPSAAVDDRPPAIERGELIEARRAGKLVGAVWALYHLTHGEVWPPRVRDGERVATAKALVDAAAAYLAAGGCRLIQAIAPAAQSDDAVWVAAGFERLARLAYLVSFDRDFPSSPPSTRLQFAPFDPPKLEQLAALVERTYQNTLDCPKLGTLRTAAEALDEYRSTDGFDPSLWLTASYQGEAVGCVLLSDPADDALELSYMGLVPEARRRGHGGELVAQAQWIARTRRKQRLVLAVDQQNAPALAVYGKHGFIGWDERVAWMRTIAAVIQPSQSTRRISTDRKA